MIALLLTLQAVTATLMPDALGRQQLPQRGCAAYLWSINDRRLVAVAAADPASLRLSINGTSADYSRETKSGDVGYGFAGSASYRRGDMSATLDLTIGTRADLADGALVPRATLTVARPGTDTVVLPVAGLIGCARPQ